MGGDVWDGWLGGGGGVNGTLSGGMIESDIGDAGSLVEGETGATGPGGGGISSVAVRLWDPGRTTASESCMLVFVFPSGFRTSANPRCKR